MDKGVLEVKDNSLAGWSMADTIKIVCANCEREVDTPRCDTDPPLAVRLEGIWCPDCDNGGFDMPDFFDANGNWLEPTPQFVSDRRSKFSVALKEGQADG